MDNLLGDHSTNPIHTPRVAHLTKQQLVDLIEEDKQVVNGVEKFGALPVSCSHLAFINGFIFCFNPC